MRPFLWFSNTVRVIWLLSFFSCVPNCRIIQHHEKPYQSYCMAAKRIVQGEELTITYTNLLMPTFMRRQKLKENWYFDCACIRLVFFLTLFSFDSNLANVLQVRGSNRIWNLCLCHQVWQQMRKQVITPTKKIQHYPRCLKISEKVSFNIVSEASYVYILSGQKLIKDAKNGSFWRVFENLKLAVKQCYQTG